MAQLISRRIFNCSTCHTPISDILYFRALWAAHLEDELEAVEVVLLRPEDLLDQAQPLRRLQALS